MLIAEVLLPGAPHHANQTLGRLPTHVGLMLLVEESGLGVLSEPDLSCYVLYIRCQQHWRGGGIAGGKQNGGRGKQAPAEPWEQSSAVKQRDGGADGRFVGLPLTRSLHPSTQFDHLYFPPDLFLAFIFFCYPSSCIPFF